MFHSYGKIHRLGKEETEGILTGTCYVQEKVDGANTSIWLHDGVLCMGSRSKQLVGDTFNGFVPYVQNHEGINNLLASHPEYRLYGEWLVKHTIQYKETAYIKFYLFDIHIDGQGFLSPEDVRAIALEYGIETVPLHGKFENPTEEEIRKFVGKTEFGDRGEGVVIKNLGFKNKFGDTVFAKIVTEDFKEKNAITFGGNNKHSDTYWEVYIVNKYMTLARIRKIMEKIQPEINEKLDLIHIPRVTSSAYHDMMTEEIWEIAGKADYVSFKALKRIALAKATQIYKDILLGTSSVADLNK